MIKSSKPSHFPDFLACHWERQSQHQGPPPSERPRNISVGTRCNRELYHRKSDKILIFRPIFLGKVDPRKFSIRFDEYYELNNLFSRTPSHPSQNDR